MICGVGNRERGDDAFGPYIVEHIDEREGIAKINCGLYPENYVSRILELSPKLVIFVDTALQQEGKPILLRNDEILERSPVSVSTHSLSLGSIYELLREQGVGDVLFLGVPALSYGQFSPVVKEIADRIVAVINDIDMTERISIMKFYEALSEQIR